MLKFLGKILVTAFAVIIAANIIKGVHINGSLTAVIVAVVLALLNNFIKPVLVVLTIPITIFTLGLFLIVINILMVKWAASLVDGFSVDGWWPALLFSIVVSIVTALIDALIGNNKENK